MSILTKILSYLHLLSTCYKINYDLVSTEDIQKMQSYRETIEGSEVSLVDDEEGNLCYQVKYGTNIMLCGEETYQAWKKANYL